SPPTWTNAAATAGNRSPAGRWNASCPGTPALKTSAPGHSRHPPDKTRANNDSTGMAAASRHAGPRHALSQDFRILTSRDGSGHEDIAGHGSQGGVRRD